MQAKLLFCFLQLILPVTIADDNEPGLPSKLPSPSKAKPPTGRAGEGGGRGQGGAANTALPGSILPNPPPQNTPVGPSPSAEPPPPHAPFGLNHIILILVPQFKTRIPHLPKWMGASCKFSVPISVFFDKLKISPPPSEELSPYPSSPFYGPLFPGGHFIQKRSVEKLLEQKSTERDAHQGSARKQSSRLNEATFRAERAALIPKVEKLLEAFGLGGKPCFLRTICETHEFPMQHFGYGLLGETLTLLLSISRSAFRDSHLSEYLEAENAGKAGDCRMYFKECGSSLFFWESIK